MNPYYQRCKAIPPIYSSFYPLPRFERNDWTIDNDKRIMDIAYSPDGTLAVATVSKIFFYMPRENRTKNTAKIKAHNYVSLAYNGDGQLAVTSDLGSTFIYNPMNGKVIRLGLFVEAILAWNQNSDQLAVGASFLGKVIIFNQYGEYLRTFDIRHISSLTYGSGNTLFVGAGRSIHVIDTMNGTIREFPVKYSVKQVVYLPIGLLAISSEIDGMPVGIYTLEGNLIKELTYEQMDRLLTIAASPSPAGLLVLGYDKRVEIADPWRDFAIIQTLEIGGEFISFSGNTMAIETPYDLISFWQLVPTGVKRAREIDVIQSRQCHFC